MAQSVPMAGRLYGLAAVEYGTAWHQWLLWHDIYYAGQLAHWPYYFATDKPYLGKNSAYLYFSNCFRLSFVYA